MYASNSQRVKAIQTAGQVLGRLPFCLDANLVMGQALVDTNRAADAEEYQARAHELDPYTAYISEQAPRVDLVPDAAVTLLALDEADVRLTTQARLDQPDWVRSLGEERAPADASAGHGIDRLLG